MGAATFALARHRRSVSSAAAMALRVANVVFGLLFALSGVVQYNDPDPVRWMVIYGAACAACIAWELRRLPKAVAGALAAVSFVWAGVIAFGIHLESPVLDALTDWQMHAGGSEELRESLGLLIVSAWMLLLGLRRKA